MSDSTSDFEKLGVFYLGREYDLTTSQTSQRPLLYDSQDLTTHAVCVGMTGSGKTGLCLSLLEEAAIDGIPAIAIDPKGDLGNLMLAFPNLQPEDFLPWIDPAVAARQGTTADEFAEQTAKLWTDGLASWGQGPERIKRFKEAADVAIYTPGSNAGLPITVLKSFKPPPPELIQDRDALRERIASAASGVLGLLGIEADPVNSREHILISTILDQAWRQARELGVAELIQEVIQPPFDRVGVLDVETFFPESERTKLAMQLNNLLASPSFASWMEGEPLEIKRLLYTETGKPRISILSIAHLSDSERMFFVTILLNEVLAWMRSQSGTSSLRAMLYMDEVFGFFPPTANPPSKRPMLTLLKQARAFGLGCVLATQNPVDLDYKGLSNAGTWFLGRLQTERDKLRVLEGLEGASASAGSTFNRSEMEARLAALGSRVFLMNNVHDDRPVVFHTRWALSYLAGPLAREQIRRLMAKKKADAASEQGEANSPANKGNGQPDDPFGDLAMASSEATIPPSVLPRGSLPGAAQAGDSVTNRPAIHDSIRQVFAVRHEDPDRTETLVYRPGLLGGARLHYVKSTCDLDVWEESVAVETIHDGELPEPLWDTALIFKQRLEVVDSPPEEAAFSKLPVKMTVARSYGTFGRKLRDHLYRTQVAKVYKCDDPRAYSDYGEPEGEFRIRIAQLNRENRDRDLEQIRARHAKKLATLQDRIDRCQERVTREESEYADRKVRSAVSIGEAILGALLGRKLASRTNVRRTSSTTRSVRTAAKERADVKRAEQALTKALQEREELGQKFAAEVAKLGERFNSQPSITEVVVRPRKSDIDVGAVRLVWLPWSIGESGRGKPLW